MTVGRNKPSLHWLIINTGDGKYNLFSNRDRYGNYNEKPIVPWGFDRSFKTLVKKIEEMEKEISAT